MADIYKLQYNGMTLAYPGWNGFVQWENPLYNISYTNDGHGLLTGDYNSGAPGTIVTLTATPNNGYALSGYAITGAEFTGNQFTINNTDITAYAAFSAVPTTALYWSRTASNTAGKGNTTTVTINQPITAFNYCTLKFQHQAGTASTWAHYIWSNFNSFTWRVRSHYNAGNYKGVRENGTFTAANSNVKSKTIDGGALRYYTSVNESTNATYKFVIDRSASRCSAFINNTYLGYGDAASNTTALNSFQIKSEVNGTVTTKQYYLAGFKYLTAATAY